MLDITYYCVAVLVVCVCNIVSGFMLENLFYKPDTCPGKILQPSSFYKHVFTKSKTRCAAECSTDIACASFYYNDQNCSLGSSVLYTDCINAVMSTSGVFYEKAQDPPCKNGGYLVSGACVCQHGFVGATCERLMYDCSEGEGYPYYNGGIYLGFVFMWVHPPTSPSAIQVKCLMRWGGRTYIQHRENGALNFSRSWAEYRDGFGNIHGDFWLGLTNIHYLTSHTSMRFEYEYYDKTYAYHQEFLREFRIANEAGKFAVIQVTPHVAHCCELGNCMGETVGRYFSTYDMDNDDSPTNCAASHQSGWWFGSCTSCNPNGPILQEASGNRLGIEAEAFYAGITDSPYSVYGWLSWTNI